MYKLWNIQWLNAVTWSVSSMIKIRAVANSTSIKVIITLQTIHTLMMKVNVKFLMVTQNVEVVKLITFIKCNHTNKLNKL